MARKIKTHRAMEIRKKELDEELRAVRRELRRRIRAEKNLPDPVAVLRRIWPGSDDSPETQPATPGAATPHIPESSAPITRPVGPHSNEGEGPVGDGPGPIRRGDARFASYFVTGGLQGIEPMRHEKKVLRWRAIFLVLLFLFLLFTLYVFFF